MSTVALTPREIPVDLFYNLSPDELDRSIADSRSGPGAPPGHTRPQLPAGRRLQIRRLQGRFPDALPPGGGAD